MRSWKHGGMLVGMVALLMLALGAAASASTGQDGPTPPELGDPVDAGQVVPHGGYDASTNFCMQCHDVHDATGAYALMANASVTATCQTCHSVLGSGIPGSAPGSGPGPGELGTVSLRTAYDVTIGAEATHTLGDSSIPGGGVVTQSDWDYGTWKYPVGPPATNASTPAGPGTSGPPMALGLYCATCHTPHGEYGQMVNNWTAADIGTEISYEWDLDSPSSGNPAGWHPAYLNLNAGSWEVCRDVGLTNCKWADIADAEDQVVSLFGYKLLTAYPNHTYEVPQTYNVEKYNHDGAGWCTACHTANDLDGPNHNHQTGCSACHGNPADGSSADFPHTSTRAEFLIDYPDALCIGCHVPGSLP